MSETPAVFDFAAIAEVLNRRDAPIAEATRGGTVALAAGLSAKPEWIEKTYPIVFAIPFSEEDRRGFLEANWYDPDAS